MDFVFSTSYDGFSPEFPNLLRHYLKTTGSNQVWTVTSTAQPAMVDLEGPWTEPSDGSGKWAASSGTGFIMQDFDPVPGDPRFGGGSVRREGALARLTDGFVDHPTPPTFLIVRFGTATGWRLGWLRVSTFKNMYAPWTPGMFGLPFLAADPKLLDMGVAPGTGSGALVVGGNSTRPRVGISLSRYVHPISKDPFLRVRLDPARSWESLEMAPRFDATVWTVVGTSMGEAFIPLRNLPAPEDTSPKFFRLR